MEKRSALGMEFFEHIKDIHDQVKQALQKSVDKYKERADKSSSKWEIWSWLISERRDYLKFNQPSYL